MYEITEPLKSDKGEIARIVRRLAEAFEIDGQQEKTKELKADAEVMRKIIQGARFEDLSDTEHNYNLLVCINYWWKTCPYVEWVWKTKYRKETKNVNDLY